ncbi:hybrid sensor histidine kinase/response regulator [Saccharospirillum salsuginis]|uniref:histidine kinase n=1 Tax=Saccharospirillum salsuginis TaxID=418750 RepID=A0A918K409_9GAMM|nr:hybrid sensor histidine kinase/response regulator [Saccharospirillum salsuginis]GGX48204.1 hybrid sensor histidine kinase/response regulator [Saccharospirillum salsuginis]
MTSGKTAPTRLLSNTGWSRLVYLCLLFVLAVPLEAAQTNLQNDGVHNIAPNIEIYEDPSGRRSPFEILSPEEADQWYRNDQDALNRGYDNTVVWLRFTLDASRSIHKQWDLVLANPLLDYIDLYQIFDDSGPRLLYRSGMARPFDNRLEDHRFFIFPLEVYGSTTYLMRIEAQATSIIPVHAYPENEFWSPLLKADILNWLYFGVILAMATYNLFLFVTVRDTSYLFYVLFISTFGLLQLSLDGYFYQYLWWNDRGFDYRINFWLAALAVIFAALFILRFLSLRQLSGRIARVMGAVIVVQLIYVGLTFQLEMDTFARLFAPNLILFMLLAIALAIYSWRRGIYAAKYFCLAWTLFGIGNLLFLGARSGWITLPFPPMFASKLGSFLETMLLSFALAHRIRSLRDERERERMRAEAQSQFLAQISHEIRTPLNGVLGMTDVLARTPLTDEQKTYVDTIQGSGASLLTLINDILDFSKIEAGKMELHREKVTLPILARQQLQLFRSQAEEKQLTLDLDIAAAVPEDVIIDVQRLRQILANLISNAIKFTDSGSITLSLALDTSGPRPQLVFRVRDTGIGIPLKAQENLFSLYHQVDPRRQFGSGTGLGLAICQQLVTLMGGSIEVRSEPDRGSEFTVRVPFDPVSGHTPIEVKSMTEAARTGLKVLVAEDNMVNQRVIEGLLSKLGHEVTLVRNGNEAVTERCKSDFDCDLVLMDCEMPDVDGYKATRFIREYEQSQGKPAIPIVALTAHALEDVRNRCLSAGMDDFLTKPINTRLLTRVLARLV